MTVLRELMLPFIYSVFIGIAWGVVFRKKFSESLAPAYLFHLLLMILSGILLDRLSIGFFVGLLLAVAGLCYSLVKNGKQKKDDPEKAVMLKTVSSGIMIFCFFYLFCFWSNMGKRFLYWDEFSHWGMFIKEGIRLDRLYCTSQLPFTHKDYVPAMSVFESMWCRLSGEYREENVYRGAQMMMYALLLPLFGCISNMSFRKSNTGGDEQGHSVRDQVCRATVAVVTAILVLALLLAFNSDDTFSFFRSIYCDLPAGLIFFFCAYIAYGEREQRAYHTFVLTVGCAVLVLTKMITVVLFGMVFVLEAAGVLTGMNKKDWKKELVPAGVLMLVPVGIWLGFNAFVDRFIPNTGSSQSLDGIDLKKYMEVFGDASRSSIPYLQEFRETYFQALFSKHVMLHGAYLLVLAVLVLLLFLPGVWDKERRKQNTVLAIWYLVFGLAFAVLMYVLYATSFTETEATTLMSYERYMNTYLVAGVFLALAVYLRATRKFLHYVVLWLIPVMLMAELYREDPQVFRKQLAPGIITGDSDLVAGVESYADAINDSTAENEKIFIMSRDYNFTFHIRYYCFPRLIAGPAIPADDGYEVYFEWSDEAYLAEALKDYDYLFFYNIEPEYADKFAGVFEKPELLQINGLYRVTGTDPVFRLAETERK